MSLIFILLGTFFLLAFLGVPIAISLGVASGIGMLTAGVSVSGIAQRMFAGVDSFSYLAIPMFMLAGKLMEYGGSRFQRCMGKPKRNADNQIRNIRQTVDHTSARSISKRIKLASKIQYHPLRNKGHNDRSQSDRQLMPYYVTLYPHPYSAQYGRERIWFVCS